MVIEYVDHLETLAMETRTSVAEEKAKPPIFDSNLDLTLPIMTGLRI